jgi:hypothetical protein
MAIDMYSLVLKSTLRVMECQVSTLRLRPEFGTAGFSPAAL